MPREVGPPPGGEVGWGGGGVGALVLKVVVAEGMVCRVRAGGMTGGMTAFRCAMSSRYMFA